MRIIDEHPQRQEIIDAILNGESLRQIGSRVSPKMNHSTLSRFKCGLIAPAIRSLRGNSDKVQQTKLLASSAGIPISKDALRNIHANQLTPSLDGGNLKQVIEGRIEKRLNRRERWIESAEGIPIRDSQGNVLIDKDGKPLVDMDHRALAAHDRNEGSDIETLAKLGGLLQQAAPVSQVLQVVVQMPAPVASEPSDCITLDVLPER